MNRSICCSQKRISFHISPRFHCHLHTQSNTNLQLLNLYVVNMSPGPRSHMLCSDLCDSMMINPLRDCRRLSRHERARVKLPQSVSADEHQRLEVWNALDFVVTRWMTICLCMDTPVNFGIEGKEKNGRRVSWDVISSSQSFTNDMLFTWQCASSC